MRRFYYYYSDLVVRAAFLGAGFGCQCTQKAKYPLITEDILKPSGLRVMADDSSQGRDLRLRS